VEQTNTPTLVMRLDDSFSSSMTLGLGDSNSTMKVYRYDDSNLKARLIEGTNWMEDFIAAKEKFLNQEYRAWRESGVARTSELPYGVSLFVRQSDQ
jgi:hypothetical protein